MHGSNRGKGIAAVAGIVLLFITFGLGLYVGALNYPEQQRYQPYRYAPDKPSEIEPTLPAGQVGAQPQEYRSPCSNPKGRDESDLCAQWRAANAGEDSAFWAKWGFWIGLGGMIGLFWTLYYTRKAVEDTGLATDAMRQSNAIAENAQRPWIDIQAELVGFSRPTPSTVKFDVSVTFKNTGAMVAENFYAVAKGIPMGEPFLAHMKSWFDKFELEESLQIRDTVVIPNQSHSYRFSDTSAYEYFPWCNLPGYRRDCYYIVLAMARYRIPGQPQWRYAMKGFSIGENIDFVDNRKLIFDGMEKMTADDIVIEPFGRSRGT